MLDFLLSGGLGTVLGGITGLFGTYLNNKKELELARFEADERQDKREHELNLMDKTHEYRMASAKLDNEQKREVSADLNMQKSYVFAQGEIDDTKNHNWLVRCLFGIVEVLRRLVRVIASYGSMVILGYMTYFIYTNLDKFLFQLRDQGDKAAAFELMQYLVFTICYVATTVILWWFGARTKRPPQIS